jgi:hypothetical protein
LDWRLDGFPTGFDIVLGLMSIAFSLFSKEFEPLGWTTGLIWGRDTKARIPRWIAGSFYFVLGAFLLYIGIRGK